MRILSILLLFILIGCRHEDRVIERVERVVERVEVRESRVDVEELFMGVGSLVYDGGDGWRSYCGGVWVGEEELLTAYHCLRDAGVGKVGSGLRVRGYGGVMGKGEVVRMDGGVDLGLVLVRGMGHGVIRVGKRGRVGDRLHVVGHAKGLEWSYLQGWVSSYREMDVEHGHGEFLQVTAPIYYGDSGGGVFNALGELVGITSFIYKVPNVGFAIRSEDIEKFLQK